jgi:hypothetical protein
MLVQKLNDSCEDLFTCDLDDYQSFGTKESEMVAFADVIYEPLNLVPHEFVHEGVSQKT